MSAIETSLQQLGLSLPPAAPPAANYIPYVISGNLVHIAGQIPFVSGKEQGIGKLGDNMGIEDGVKVAEICALNILAQITAAVGGDESKIIRCVKINGFVNCTPEFTQQPAVMNGASNLLVAALGDRGKHARSAVGVTSLPFGVAVEVDAIFEIKA